MTANGCAVPRCRGRAALIYLDFPVCAACWLDFAEDPDGLREALGLPPIARPAVETVEQTKASA
jgi:hypothetical protein